MKSIVIIFEVFVGCLLAFAMWKAIESVVKQSEKKKK